MLHGPLNVKFIALYNTMGMSYLELKIRLSTFNMSGSHFYICLLLYLDASNQKPESYRMLFHNRNYIFLYHQHICRCRLGWAGEICTDCQVLPGCQHGYCTKPLECRCHEGYTGLLCQTRMYHVIEGQVNTVRSLTST